jgi:phenylalanyl-tRNA synthetase beta chain
VSWLRALVPGLTATSDEIAAALVRAGLEVEQLHRYGQDVRGVVTGQVLDVQDLTGFKKPIRYCHVDVGARVHEVVCGATNFAAGDRVAFALPGAVLPGGFAIATRQTYGHTSDGMICSGAELGLSEESDGILVLPADTPLGVDVVELLQLRDEVLDIAVTPDRGYQLSVRGRGARGGHRLRPRPCPTRARRGAGRLRRRLPGRGRGAGRAATATSPAS